MYKVLPKFEKLGVLFYPLPGGRRVNLLGKDVEVEMPPTKAGPGVKIKVKAATQAEMKMIHDQPGTKLIEFIPDKEESKTT